MTGKPTAGYSGTPLVHKLGIKPGMRVEFIGAPPSYKKELVGMPKVDRGSHETLDFVQMFVDNRADLAVTFPSVKARLARNGMIWVSWPKKSSGVQTDLTEDVVRSVGLANSMVDIKVCAVNDIWSGLKFVYRKRDR